MGKREEAARAVCKALGVDPDNILGNSEPAWTYNLSVVDAVIACIREPDEKMLMEGIGGLIEADRDDRDGIGHSNAIKCWQRMTDAIGD